MSEMIKWVGAAIEEAMRIDYGFDLINPEEVARAAIEALHAQTLVYRQDGQVVHELRGAPDDIWKALLDAALTP